MCVCSFMFMCVCIYIYILGEHIKNRQPWYTVVGNVIWCSCCEKKWRFLKKLKVELPYDLEIPLLVIQSDNTIIQKDTCTPWFIAALFIIATT